MKTIIILTHGEFSTGIAASLRMIMGNIDNLFVMSITLQDDIHDIVSRLKSIISNDIPTIIVTDIPGGSTTQAALKASDNNDLVYVVSGLNLALLIALAVSDFTDDHMINSELIRKAVDEGKASLYFIDDNDIVIQSGKDDEL